ncbi:MAG: hypothetical protein WBC22_03040 [Sedimentisphaerales bacterium]
MTDYPTLPEANKKKSSRGFDPQRSWGLIDMEATKNVAIFWRRLVPVENPITGKYGVDTSRCA